MTIHEFGKENKETIILIHPSVVKWDYFENVIPLLEKNYHLLVPALPGYDFDNDNDFTSVELIAQKEGSDPAAVIYDAISATKSRNADVLICDTAGRLHNKKNLMEELKKINRIIDKEYPEAYRETLVVLDGTTGQNALVQARQFMEAADITGIILTKLDGTAKGGIAVAIQSELGIPVKYVGVGEKIDDLQKFNSEDFVNALFAKQPE